MESIGIYVDILRVVSRGASSPTTISHLANVNYPEFKAKMRKLVDHGLVEEEALSSNRKKYRITESGLEVIKLYDEIMRLMPFMEKRLKFKPSYREV